MWTFANKTIKHCLMKCHLLVRCLMYGGFWLLLHLGVFVGGVRGIESFKSHCEESKMKQMSLLLK